MRMFGLAAIAALLFLMAPTLNAASESVHLCPTGSFTVMAQVSPTSGGSVVFKRDGVIELDEFTIDFMNGTLFVNGVDEGSYDANHQFEVAIHSVDTGGSWMLTVEVKDLDANASIFAAANISCNPADSASASAAAASIFGS